MAQQLARNQDPGARVVGGAERMGVQPEERSLRRVSQPRDGDLSTY